MSEIEHINSKFKALEKRIQKFKNKYGIIQTDDMFMINTDLLTTAEREPLFNEIESIKQEQARLLLQAKLVKAKGDKNESGD